MQIIYIRTLLLEQPVYIFQYNAYSTDQWRHLHFSVVRGIELVLLHGSSGGKSSKFLVSAKDLTALFYLDV